MYPVEITEIVCSNLTKLDCAKEFYSYNNNIFLTIFGFFMFFIIVQLLFVTFVTKKKGIAYWLGIIGIDFILLIFIIIFILFTPNLMVFMNLI